MRTKLLLLVAPTLFFISCGPSKADIEKTCECEGLMSKMRALEAEYQVSDRISSSEASKKVRSENQEAYDKCIKLHNDMGDDNYFKASQKCGNN